MSYLLEHTSRAALRFLSRSMGTRCFSHDSIFMPAGQGEEEKSIQAISQEYLGGNVKALQQQLSGNIHFGLRPDSIPRKRMQGLGASTGEMDTSHISPMEIGGEQDKGPQQKAATMVTGSSSSFSSMNNIELEHKTEEKVTPVKPSRSKRPFAVSGTIESINLDAVPRSVDRLDNTFAKHKLSVKPKNQRVSKKHRGMSQEYIEDTEYENESDPMRNSLNTLYNSTEISGQNLHKSDQSQWKKTEVQSPEKVKALIKSEEGKDIKTLGKQNEEEKKLEKYQELISPKHRPENKPLDELEKNLQLKKQQQEEEEERKKELKKQLEMKEQQRLEEERRQQAEQILQELEEHRRQEQLKLREREEQKAIQKAEQLRLEEEKRQRAEQILQELEEYRRQEELKLREREEQKAFQQAEEQRQEEERQRQEEQKKIEEQKQQELKLLEKQNQQKKKDINTKLEVCFLASDTTVKDKDVTEKEEMIVETSQDEEIQQNKQQMPSEEQEQGRISEELRWKELDQRQRPFTFKVTAGEKQILFQRVNLSPVTPSKEATVSPDSLGQKEIKPNINTHVLPSSHCVPHTAILVTGAQLCGTAVNLDQIKDTACKSLLGLTDEKKHLDNQTIKSEKGRQDTTQMSSKTKYTSQSLDSQSILDEWTSIRSKILSKSENISMLEKTHRNSHLQRDDLTGKGSGELHSNLRKTLSASAKFSITPAWQKFAESVKPQQPETMSTQSNTEAIAAAEVKPALSNDATQDKSLEVNSLQETIPTKLRKQVTSDNSTEGFIFSKDLPSFLVPHPPHSPRRGQAESQTGLELQGSNGTRKNDKTVQNGEEKTSPFGVKLRRTNYSLRFHSDPLNDQKRKKRYSAGDSFDGVPASFSAADETEPSSTSRKELSASPTKIKKDNLASVSMDTSSSLTDLHSVSPPLISSSSSYIPSPNRGRTVPKSLSVEKPYLAPKPPNPTPTPSVLSKLDRSNLVDLSVQKLEKSDPNKEMLGESIKGSVALLSSSPIKNEEPEAKDKKYSFPSIPIPWREKSERRPEHINKDRPTLQSRHSLDGTRLMEKSETAQPLWITLALQKQKGFREQHASREERRQAREAKLSDKITKENASEPVITGEYRNRSGSLQKPVAQEEKKCETVVTRLQRREQLQKSNTLPTSVTVEITDAVQVPPLAKDIPKRFSTPDASPVSSEPAWLALAKRKSKAWSDCPQIIK
uniref:Capping protein-inhibiting regulator of actin dynamics n=1 Tax=Xenopus tropicalis TaxID=8364 RepID=F6ZAQ8_XENTR